MINFLILTLTGKIYEKRDIMSVSICNQNDMITILENHEPIWGTIHAARIICSNKLNEKQHFFASNGVYYMDGKILKIFVEIFWNVKELTKDLLSVYHQNKKSKYNTLTMKDDLMFNKYYLDLEKKNDENLRKNLKLLEFIIAQ